MFIKNIDNTDAYSENMKAITEIGNIFVRGRFRHFSQRRTIRTYFGCNKVICSVVAAYAPLRGVKNIC
ncbi:MAG: hypothetical protein D4R73_04480 [Deltaproteobacteria bacterium]|nr:MAG: hypothetical protein D4R73_04480 [Deltaproteobacteria bacterium]